jgi:plastocyanin
MCNVRTNVGWLVGGVMLATAALAACGGGDAGSSGEPAQASPASSPAAAGGPQTPDPGRKVITVEMLTDEQGNNIFRPANLEAHQGDVLRFTLVSGVHNVNFVADSNPGKAGLPAPSQFLQLPGQTHDIKVTRSAGKYYFHCDPHALLGMRGWLEVEAED